MQITRAAPEDIPRIMECAREFTAILPDCPLDEAHYNAFLTRIVTSGAGVLFILENENGVVVGGLVGIVSDDFLTGKLHAVELAWYVKRDYRKGLWPIRMLKAFEDWAKSKGCVHVSMIYMEASQPDKMKSFYQHRGYSLLETVYRKKLCPLFLEPYQESKTPTLKSTRQM